MGTAFLAAELGKWDVLQGKDVPELLVLPFFSDERPLRGAAGLCDFRLCGRLSRLLLGGRVRGAFGETTLYPPGRRLPFPRLLLFGLGESDRFDEGSARAAARRIEEVVRGLGVKRHALALPGRSTGRLSARRALELYLDETRGKNGDSGPEGARELLVVESTAGQKEAAELVRQPPSPAPNRTQ